MNWKNSATVKKTILQFVKFCLVGAVNSGVSLVIYYIFTAIDERMYIVGYILGYVISIFVAYLLNKVFVFEQKKNTGHAKLLVKIYLVYGITLAIGSGFILLQTDILGISKKIAPIINLFLTVPINFILNKFWVFKAQ